MTKNTPRTKEYLVNQQALATIATTHPAVMKAAAATTFTTQTDIRSLLRLSPIAERGPLSTAVAEVLEVRRLLDRNRWLKQMIMDRRGGHAPKSFVPLISPAQRHQKLTRIRDAALRPHIEYHYRFATHGDVSLDFTADHRQVGVSQYLYDSWDIYAKSYNHPAHCVDTTITAPADWRGRVEHRGLAVVDGLVNLDIVALDCTTSNVRLYAATWLQNGAGNELHAESGYIALTEEHSYHGTTPEKAVRGVLRKARQVAVKVAIGRQSLAALVAHALAVDPDIAVTLHDATSTGACLPGIKAWCSRTGIDFDAQSAPLSEIYAAYQRVPASECAAIMIHTIRRSRRVIDALLPA